MSSFIFCVPVFVEEAAEMLESHIVAALTKETQHLVLIGKCSHFIVSRSILNCLHLLICKNFSFLGDHQQLRPTTSVYQLAKKYNMDISLFERMLNNGINCTQMNVQHRMRPIIANLIRPSIYKDLTDHECVKNFSQILGIDKNVFFLTHKNAETKVKLCFFFA